eukprot:477839_1
MTLVLAIVPDFVYHNQIPISHPSHLIHFALHQMFIVGITLVCTMDLECCILFHFGITLVCTVDLECCTDLSNPQKRRDTLLNHSSNCTMSILGYCVDITMSNTPYCLVLQHAVLTSYLRIIIHVVSTLSTT